jgi:hypothetical protein
MKKKKKFFHESGVSWVPEYPIRTISFSSRKFTERFSNECLSTVSMTLAIKQNNFEV